MNIKEELQCLGFITALYFLNQGFQYLGFKSSLEFQALLCGKDSSVERAEDVLNIAKAKPYDVGRFLFFGIESGALDYLVENSNESILKK